ncbi:MAG: aminotransferase [Caulobacteraceae bacterium]|nr:aminotransferase [Caulobacteraceae bacterium]
MSVYLDYNATAPIRPEARDAALAAMETLGNPSSVHAAGRAARALVETARGEVAALVGVRAGSLTFTSGGTEANALAIESAILAGYDRVIVGATEHGAVAENARAHASVETWPVDADGLADLDWLREALARPGRALVCLMHANNETGVVQPVAEAADLVRAADGWLHVDAVGSAGKLFIDLALLGADTLAIAGHKIGAPFGVGALAAGPRSKLSRILHGGGQEQGRRAGAENVSGVAGFGAAAKAAARDLPVLARQAAWRDAAQAAVEADGAVVFGKAVQRLPQTLCFAAEGFDGALQVMNLDLAGVMISAGAACSSGKVKPSATVAAMGREELAGAAIRVSGGWATTEADWRAFTQAWLQAHARHRARRKELA